MYYAKLVFPLNTINVLSQHYLIQVEIKVWRSLFIRISFYSQYELLQSLSYEQLFLSDLVVLNSSYNGDYLKHLPELVVLLFFSIIGSM